jgi:hypothetical protein
LLLRDTGPPVECGGRRSKPAAVDCEPRGRVASRHPGVPGGPFTMLPVQRLGAGSSRVARFGCPGAAGTGE